MTGRTYGIKKRAGMQLQEAALATSITTHASLVDNFLPIPAKKAAETTFPPGCAVLLCCYEAPKITEASSYASSPLLAPFPVISKVLPGIVQEVGVSLGSNHQDTSCKLYRVRVQESPCHGPDNGQDVVLSTNSREDIEDNTARIITVKEYDLVHAIGATVWFSPVVVHGGQTKEQKGIILGAQQLPSHLWSTAGATGSSIWYSIQQPLGDSTGTFLVHHGIRAHKVRHRSVEHKMTGRHHHRHHQHVGKKPKEDSRQPSKPKRAVTFDLSATVADPKASNNQTKEKDTLLGSTSGHDNAVTPVVGETLLSTANAMESNSPAKDLNAIDTLLPILSKSFLAGVEAKPEKDGAVISRKGSVEAKPVPDDTMGEHNEETDVVPANVGEVSFSAVARPRGHQATALCKARAIPFIEQELPNSTEETQCDKGQDPWKEDGICEDKRPTPSPEDTDNCKPRECLGELLQNHETGAENKKAGASVSGGQCSGKTSAGTGHWLRDKAKYLAQEDGTTSVENRSAATSGQCLVDKENVVESCIHGCRIIAVTSRSGRADWDVSASTKKRRALSSASSTNYGVQLDESTFVSAEEIKRLIQGARMEANRTADSSFKDVANNAKCVNTAGACTSCTPCTIAAASTAPWHESRDSTTNAPFGKVGIGADVTATAISEQPLKRSEPRVRRVSNPNKIEGFRVGWNHDFKQALDMIRQIRTNQWKIPGGFGEVGEFLNRRCLRFHLAGKCFTDCPRASDHNRLSPETAKALEDALAPVTGPEGPIYGRRTGEWSEDEPRKRQKVDSFAPSPLPLRISDNVIRFHLPVEFGKDFLISAITGRCGSNRLDMCKQYACTIDFKGALMENTLNLCYSAAKLYVEIKGEDPQNLSKCCQAIENILVQAVPKDLRGYLLNFLSFKNQRVVGGYRSLSVGIMSYTENPFCCEDEGRRTHYICKLNGTCHAKTRSEFDACKKKAKEEGCPPCSVYLVEKDPSFGKIKPHMIVVSPNFDYVLKSRKFWRQWT